MPTEARDVNRELIENGLLGCVVVEPLDSVEDFDAKNGFTDCLELFV